MCPDKTFDETTFDEITGFRSTDVEGVPYCIGEFWTSRQRQGHPMHEVSYRACFKAELPEFFISRLTNPGDGVYDPFAGRGTTAIQAAIQGRRPMGNDVNPLSAMLCRPRLEAPTLEEVSNHLAVRPAQALSRPLLVDPSDISDSELLPFFHPETLQNLRHLRARFISSSLSRTEDWIRMVCLNRLTGHSAGYFSGYTLPPNQAASAAAQRKINKDRGLSPPARDVSALILRKSKSLLRGESLPPSTPILTTGLAWQSIIPTGSVALVVTSPPFLDVVRYDRDNWLRCWFAGIHPATVPISHLKNEAEWQGMVNGVLGDLARVVRSGGHVAFEVGEVRGGKVLLERLVWEAVGDLPFKRLGVMINGGSFTKTAAIWKVANNDKGTNTNRIVVLRRM